ncbi:hypothetical protein ES703_48922 [subsurface metagenome]
MKKFFKVFLIIVLLILAVLFASPFLFKGKIISIANEQLEKNLNAKASFSDINISLIRNFPNAGVRLKNLVVVGIESFEGDTLLTIHSIDIALDIISAIKMENIKIKRIYINKPYVNAIVLETGEANWDIVPEKAEDEPEDTTATEFTAQVTLKVFKISNASLNYSDYKSRLLASFENLNFTLSGDLSKDFSELVIDSKTEKVNLVMGGIRYAKNLMLSIHFDIDANLKESIYKLNENSVSLNKLTLNFDGSLEIPEPGNIITNLAFNTGNTDFKTLLSLVPAIYMTDFTDLKTTGSLKLDGNVKGSITENTTPSVDLKLLVKNATFSYPDLPKSADNIEIDLDLHYDGIQIDNTTLDVNKFHVDLGTNSVDLSLNLRNPVTDPFTNGQLVAAIDLATVGDVVPIENTEMKGIIKVKLDWMGKVSSIENQKYDEFKADGNIEITNLFYNSADIPRAFLLKESKISFSPEFMEVSSFSATLGLSDFSMYGQLSNYIPYVLKDETIKGKLTLNSNHIDLNEFMAESKATEEPDPKADTLPLEVIEVPGNIDFRLQASISELFYDKLEINDVKGIIVVKDKKVIMENLSMNMLDGNFILSGEYNTQDIKSPLVDFNFNASNIDVSKCFVAFDVLARIAPIASKTEGKVSLGMRFTSFLASDMKPVLSSIAGEGSLASRRLTIKSSDAFSAIGNVLNTDAFNNLALNDLEIDFEIIDGHVFVDPFETRMGDVTMLIAGEQSFENTLNYGINLSAPSKLLGLENKAINDLYKSAASKGIAIPKSETVNLLAKITGKMKDPKVSIDLKDNITKTTTEIKEELIETGKQVIEEKKEEAKKEAKKQARAEADKIMKEAEKQAANVKSEAKRLADAVRYEANANAKKLLDEARNPITQAAAEPAAKKLRSEGEKKARKIESEADAKAEKILKNARIKADKLLE